MTRSPTHAPATLPRVHEDAFHAAMEARIGASGARRLAAISGAKADLFHGLKASEIGAKFGHVIDPRWLFMQRVCGQVVRTDASGRQLPVPFATVEVQDTDCSLLGFFPVDQPWGWMFPYFCHRETIATTKTDACGKFCVWVPRFDIDWVLRWRAERVCFPVIFQRPSLADLVASLKQRLPSLQEVPRMPFPGPGPDPAPDLERLARLAQGSDSALAAELARLARLPGQSFGDATAPRMSAMAAPARLDIAPPLPAGFLKREVRAGREDHHVARHTIASQLRTTPEVLEGFSPERWIGPLLRCEDILVPEWVPIVDVPDITFRVLQDVNGDGVEEPIYDESYFDVRWNAGAIPDVTLEASPIARTAPSCQPTGGVPCGDVPAIVTAGRLPLTGDPTTFDTATGYGLRTNRPHPSGTTIDPLPHPEARSPVYGKLSLFGCNETDKAATHYRITYRYKAPGSASFSAAAPFVGVSWWLYRLNAVGLGEWFAPTSDASGWYPIVLPAGPHAWLPEDLLLDWPTGGAYADGTYELVLELGTPVGGASSASSPVHVVVDNAAPAYTFDIAWRPTGSGTWQPIAGDCPVVKRGAMPVDVDFRVTVSTTSRHFRNAFVYPLVCGAQGMSFTSGSGGHVAGSTYEYWHEDVSVGGVTLDVVWKLPAAAAQGTYGFAGRTVSRAFSPDVVNAPPAAAFEYDGQFVWLDFSRMFSVFDVNP